MNRARKQVAPDRILRFYSLVTARCKRNRGPLAYARGSFQLTTPLEHYSGGSPKTTDQLLSCSRRTSRRKSAISKKAAPKGSQKLWPIVKGAW